MNKDFHIEFGKLEDVAEQAKVAMAHGPSVNKINDSAVFENLNDFMEFMFPGKFTLLMMIKAKSPGSLYELAQLVNKSQSGVLRECKELELMGFISLIKEGPRNSLVPRLKFEYDRIVVHGDTGDCYHTLPVKVA